MKALASLFLLFVLTTATAFGQPAVVVSEYFSTNSTSGVGEWTELVVLDDLVDLRGYLLVDNNAAQTERQGGVRFRNIPLWQHLRKGTVIVVNHRDNAGLIDDADPSDGYIELRAINTNYFDTLQFSNPNFYWTSVALNIASGGDILEILNPTDVHVHSLSHRQNTGSYYNAMALPKPNMGSSLPDNSSVAIAPGGATTDYSALNGSVTILSAPTKGLANASANETLWRSLRQPPSLPSSGVFLASNVAFTTITVTWTAIDDLRPEDQLSGYIVLRNTSNNFAVPVDGTTYNVGDMIGSATVVANVVGSNVPVCSDNIAALNIGCGERLYYRIYPYRFGTDNLNGNSYNAARGRAYNTTAAATGLIEKVFNGQAAITTSGAATFCEGESVALTADPVGASYEWFRNGNPITGATGRTYTATTAGAYTVRITAANGCTSTSTAVDVTVRPLPATVMATIPAQCQRNNSFAFAQTGVPGASYQWNFGADASPATSTDEDPSGISYSTPGAKLVTLTVTKDGCTFTTTQTIQVHPTPSVTIMPVVPICEGDSVQLVASAINGDTYTWSGAGLSSNSIRNPWAKPTQTTTYTLTVSNATGCSTQEQVTVTVLPRPRVRIQTNGPTTVCAGITITLSDDGTSGGGQFTWLPGFQSGPVLTVSHDNPGVYVYRLVLVGGNGCRDTSNPIAITVTSKPEALISTPDGITLCPGKTVTLAANDIPGATYRWSNGASDRTIQVGRGTYTVQVSLGPGCESTSVPVTVSELTPSFRVSTPSVQFDELGKCESVAEKTITLTNNGSEDLTISSTASPHFVAPGAITIPRGGSATATLRFAPTGGPGSYMGRIYFTALPCGIRDSIDVTGVRAGTSDATLDLTAVSFPTRYSCTTTPQDTVVTFTNVGQEVLRITSVSVPLPFRLQSHTPGAFPVVLAAGASESFTFRYDPSTTGAAAEDAVLRYETGECRDSLLVSLTGLYITPSLAGDRSTLQFTPLPGCEEYRDSIVVVSNTGTVEITVDASFDPPGEFFVLNHSSQTIPPGGQDTIAIRFRPTGSGTRLATLTVHEHLCSTATTIALSGVKQGISFAANDRIDFDALVLPCGSGSTTAVLTISNTSDDEADGTIVSAIVQNASSAFGVAIPAGTPLGNGESKSFTVSFAPTSDGVFSDVLLVHLQPCDIIRRIPLSGVRGRASLDKTAAVISTAPQPVGSSINATVEFRNNGTVPVTVTSIDGIAAPFALVGVQPPVGSTLLPDSILTVTVKYTADDDRADSIPVHIVCTAGPSCVIASDSTLVVGSGIRSSVPLPVRVEASLPVLSGSPGDEILYTLVLNSAGLDTAGVTGVDAYLSFNGTMLLPLATAAGATAPGFTATFGETQPGRLHLALHSASSVLTGSGVAAEVRFRVLLGGAMTTPLAIDSVVLTASAPVSVTRSDGMFILRDSCAIETRLLDVAGATALAVAGMDDASTIIELSTAYDGPVTLTLYDALGRETQQILHGDLRAGVYRVTVPTGALPDGMYFVVLKAGTIVRTTGMPLAR